MESLHTHPPTKTLTSREMQVLELLLTGAGNKDVGAALRTSPRTAQFHATNLLHKLDFPDRRSLMAAVLLDLAKFHKYYEYL